MSAELVRYRALGIDYADSAFAPAFHITASTTGRLRIELANQVASGTMRYTTDGSQPTKQSTSYAGTLTLSGKTTLRAATFTPDGFELAAPRTQVLDENTLSSRDGSALLTCSHQPPSRLEGSKPAQGTRPVYAVDIGNACWLWPQATLNDAKHVTISVERIAWRFGDEAKDAVVRSKSSATGEFEIHADTCAGPMLASLPLQGATATKGQTKLEATLAMPAGASVRNLCIFATGDPRDGQWALARITFSK
jgi:hexosaminidase